MSIIGINNNKARKENEERVAEEYFSSLSDLNCNSKPLINMLTMLAEENIEYAPVIVKVVADHIHKVPSDIKLPILYLIDSIVKNVKSAYVTLFSQCIVNIFCHVFENVNEKIRERMYALRHTWHEIFSTQKLFALDVQVKKLDNNWPITAKPSQPSIHVNPNFLKTGIPAQTIPSEMEEILQAKTRELLELKKRKLELELEATKKHLEEQGKQLSMTTETVMPMAVDVVTSSVAVPLTLGGEGGMTVSGAPVDATNIVFNQQFRGNKGPNVRLPMPSSMVEHSHPVKQKVYPVHPAMVRAIRSRDPRLLRQQQHQQLQGKLVDELQSDVQSKSQSIGNGGGGNRKVESGNGLRYEENASSSTSARGSSHKSNRNSNGHGRGRSDTRGESKSTQNSVRRSPSSSSYSSSSRSGSKSHTNRGKSKDHERISSHSDNGDQQQRHDRKKNENKNAGNTTSTTTTASSSSIANEWRSISDNLGTNSSPVRSKKLHMDGSEDFGDQPIALKSASGMHLINANKDIDLRHPVVGAGASYLIKPSAELSSDVISPASTISAKKMSAITTTTTATVKPNASQNLDKCESLLSSDAKSIFTSSSLALTSSAAPLDVTMKYSSGKTKRKAHERSTSDDTMANKQQKEELIADDIKTTGSRIKRRSSITEDESNKAENNSEEDKSPSSKRAKALTNMDILFGEEDVDLRTTLQGPGMLGRPGVVSPSTTGGANRKGVTDPFETNKTPPKITSVSNVARQSANKKSPTGRLSSNLEDVRAKLAKTARLNTIKATVPVEKPTVSTARDQSSNRLKLAELNSNNDDVLEDNDEKIRTIMAQAQELLDTKSITHEQYKNLVHTVMSINETNKLKEAKRRESFTSTTIQPSIVPTKEPDNENHEDESDTRRREAVLKKRIPKINKKVQQQSSMEQCFQNELPETSNTSKEQRNEHPFVAVPQRDDLLPTKTKINSKELNITGGKPLKIKWNERVNKSSSLKIPPPPTTNDFDVSKLWMVAPPNHANKNRFIEGIDHVNQPPTHILPPMTHSPWLLNQSAHGVAAISNNNNIPTMPAIADPSVIAVPSLMPQIGSHALQPPKPCNSIDNPQADLVRTITIDSMAKEIRIYDQVAIVFMELDQPREIGFKGGQRAIFIDNQEPIILHFNDAYRSFTISGETHQLRFGFPSRELYIDDQWYEIYFGGTPITIPIGNSMHYLKAEGPPPQVNIGPLRRDLVVGKINMIVDAHIVIPLFLDAKVQAFQLGDGKHTLQFADQLITVLLDDTPMQVEYGGLPKSVVLGGRKYFIRFGTLPQHVVAGKVQIQGMRYVNTTPKIIEELPPSQPSAVTASTTMSIAADGNGTSLIQNSSLPKTGGPIAPVLANLNIDELFQKLVSSGILGGGTSGGDNKLSANTSTVATTIARPAQNDEKLNATDTNSAVAADDVPLITETTEPVIPAFDPIDLRKPDSIKVRQQSIIVRLFSGMQCGSCGLRFSPEQTLKYSQHLDWHFRLNRRERDLSRKTHSRKWYYDLNDWMQYEEIEDIDDKNLVDNANQNDGDTTMDEASNHHSVNSPIQSCPAKPEDVDRMCDMCQERFEQFYHEELEEWHLRSAVSVDDKIYHPLCYEDYKAAQALSESNIKADVSVNDDNAMDTIISVPDASIIVDEEENPTDTDHHRSEDMDDDVILLPNEEPMITEIEDDDECEVTQQESIDNAAIINATENEQSDVDKSAVIIKPPPAPITASNENLNDTAESDVEIQEPHIPFTDLDTYVEKEIPPRSEQLADSQFDANIKIKQERKDSLTDDEHDDDDDVFEEVGTVIAQINVEIPTPVIAGKITPAEVNSNSVASEDDQAERLQLEIDSSSIDTEKSQSKSVSGQDLYDGDMSDTMNLSASGIVSSAMPITNLINKIKINITKNNATNTAAAVAVTEAKAHTTTTSNIGNLVSRNSNQLKTVTETSTSVSLDVANSDTRSGVSSIPVLCSGMTNVTSGFSAHPTSIGCGGGGGGSGGSKNSTAASSVQLTSNEEGVDIGKGGPSLSTGILPMSSVSNISVVIGSSYADAPSSQQSLNLQLHSDVGMVVQQVPTTITVATVETAEPVYELKPSLQKTTLKKRQPVNCGVDTSGLCSIM